MGRIRLLILLIIVIAAGMRMAEAAEQTVSHGSSGSKGNYDYVLDEEYSLYYLPSDGGGPLMTHISQNEPPLLRNLSISPEKPGPDNPVTVTAEIYNDPVNTVSKTMEATLHYSTDGKNTWKIIDMTNEKGDRRTWEVEIPALGEAGVLNFYISAVDDADNIFVELPVTDVNWGAARDEGYLFSFKDENDVYTLVNDDVDILSASFGYDGENIYASIVVEGEISGGTVTPFDVNVYSVGFYVPTGRREIGPKPRYVLTHSQHAQFITFPVIGLLDVEKHLAEVTTADPRYYSRRNHLYLTMKKSILDQQKHDYVRMVVGTASGVNPLPLQIVPKDVSSFVNIVFGDHEIVIE